MRSRTVDPRQEIHHLWFLCYVFFRKQEDIEMIQSVILLVVLIGVNAIFASAEIAVISVN